MKKISTNKSSNNAFSCSNCFLLGFPGSRGRSKRYTSSDPKILFSFLAIHAQKLKLPQSPILLLSSPLPLIGNPKAFAEGISRRRKIVYLQRIHMEFYAIVCFFQSAQKMIKNYFTYSFHVLKIKESLQPQMPQLLFLLKEQLLPEEIEEPSSSFLSEAKDKPIFLYSCLIIFCIREFLALEF